MGSDISNLSAQNALTEIAKMAYGSGTFEGKSGGKGNIGLLNGRVVKFNTHWSERHGSSTTDEMRKSCDDLREKLRNIISENLTDVSPLESEACKMREELYKKLGYDANGQKLEPTRTPLLDRKVVASIVSRLENNGKFNIWSEVKKEEDFRNLSSKGQNTTFDTVKESVLGATVAEHPDVDNLMEVAGFFISTNDRKGFTQALELAKGVNRFSLATVRQDLVKNEGTLKESSQDLWDRHEAALVVLNAMKDDLDTPEAIKARAKSLLEQLETATAELLAEEKGEVPPSIEKLSNFIWAITEAGALLDEDVAETSKVSVAEPRTASRSRSRIGSPSDLVRAKKEPVTVSPHRRGVVRDVCELLVDATRGENSFFQKIGQDSTIIKTRANRGGGSCFFYSALQQMTNSEFDRILLDDDRSRLKGQYSDNRDCVKAFRKAFVRHSQDLINRIKNPDPERPMPWVTYHPDADQYKFELTDVWRDQNPMDITISPAMEQLGDKRFTHYSEEAELDQAVFLADFLKRPVTVVVEMPGWKYVGEGENKTRESYTRVDFLTCNRSLSDGSQLTGEPIMIYYRRSLNGQTGHYEALAFEGPAFQNP